MSAVIQPKDFSNFIVETFNIKSGSMLTVMNISKKIESLSDPLEFIQYAEQTVSCQKLQFLTGYQKFLKVFNDYIKSKLQLNPKAEGQIAEFSDKLTKRLTDITIQIHYLLQVNGHPFSCYVNTFEKNLNNKQIEVCKDIGTWEDVYRKALHGPHNLEKDILDICYQKAMLKINPNIAIENKNKGPIKIGNLISKDNLVIRNNA